MNLTKFEWVKSDLKQRFYKQFKFSDNLVNSRKRILLSNRQKYIFNVEKTYSADYARDCGLHYQNRQGLFSKTGTETLFSNLGRWLRIGRLRSRLGKGWPASSLEQAPPRRRAMAGGLKLVGASRFRVSEHQNQHRDLREIEEDTASSPTGFTRAES